MAGLRETVRDQFAKNKQRVKMPWWVPRLGLVMLVIIMLVGFFQFASSDGGGDDIAATTTTTAPALVAPGGSSGAPTQEQQDYERFVDIVTGGSGTSRPGGTTVPGPTPTTTPSGTGGAKVLNAADGTRITVEGGAYAAAVAALKAKLGDQAVIAAELVQNATASSVTFTFTATPPGSGPTVLAVTVTKSGGEWSS